MCENKNHECGCNEYRRLLEDCVAVMKQAVKQFPTQDFHLFQVMDQLQEVIHKVEVGLGK